jgi:hypothetical protein
MIGEQVTRILINKREKRWNPKNLGPLFLTGSSRPALGKPANRYSNSRDTYVNPITNIFPGLIAGLFWRSARVFPIVESGFAIGADALRNLGGQIPRPAATYAASLSEFGWASGMRDQATP